METALGVQGTAEIQKNMDKEKRIGYLFNQARLGMLTPEEEAELSALRDSSSEISKLFQHDVVEGGIITVSLKQAYEMDETRVEQGVKNYIQASSTNRSAMYVIFRRSMMAAAILILISTGIWLAVHTPKSRVSSPGVVRQHLPADVPPGKNRAILTLADNTTIDLDNAGGGQIAAQGQVRLLKIGNGELRYEAVNKNPSADKIGTNEVAFNTLRTPIASQYEITLPDGTKVALNNASQLRYPVSFQGKERVVELSGEGYFEVAHGNTKPFVVQVGGQQIIVLGTTFNITAYAEEPAIRTVLVDGKVKVSMGEQSTILKPGFQSANKNGRLEVVEVNVRSAIAWRRGYFSFSNASLESVLTQICRWYGLTLDRGPDGIPEKHFEGEIRRDETLAAVLTILKQHGVECELEEGMKLKVTQVLK